MRTQLRTHTGTRAQAPRLVYLEEGAKERMLTSLSQLEGCEVQNSPITETRKLSSNKLDRPSSDKMEPMTEVRRSKGESSLFIEWQLCMERGGAGWGYKWTNGGLGHALSHTHTENLFSFVFSRRELRCYKKHLSCCA